MKPKRSLPSSPTATLSWPLIPSALLGPLPMQCLAPGERFRPQCFPVTQVLQPQTDSPKPRPRSPRPWSERREEAVSLSPPRGPPTSLWPRWELKSPGAAMKHNCKRWSYLERAGAGLSVRPVGTITPTISGRVHSIWDPSLGSRSRESMQFLA